MPHRTSTRGRRGFTLVELLVVIGLMSVLGTLSVTGYFAATRGMKVRGAVQDTISFIRNAQQVCLIDQTPTAILFLNRYTGRRDDGGEMYGTAVAIKMAGRISMKASSGKAASGGTTGSLLIDEFADWNVSFPREAGSGSDVSGKRLYNMRNIRTTAKQGLKNCSSLMNGWVGYVRMADLAGKEWLPMAGVYTDRWCDEFQKNPQDNNRVTATAYNNGNDYRWGFSFHDKNDGLDAGGWNIGDAYGTQIAEFELPRGFIFGASAPNEDGEIKPAAGTSALVFYPDDVNNSSFSIDTVDIYASGMKSDGTSLTKIGSVRTKDLKDQD